MKLLSAFDSLKTAIALLSACLAGGFAVGKYYGEIQSEAKIRDIENQKNLQSAECREKNLELREIYQNQVLDLKNEIANCKLLQRGQNENEK
jgi:hypothetical protein